MQETRSENMDPLTSLGFLPGERELRTRGGQLVNFLSAVDPVQGIMRGMSASGRAFDDDLPPEVRRQAAIEAALETAVPVGMTGLGSLLKQPAKALLLDLFTLTGAPGSMARKPGTVPRVDRVAPASSMADEDLAAKVGSGIPKVDMIEGSPAGLYNQTVTQSAVDLINDPAFGEGFAERLMEVAAENSIAVGDRTFMPMDVYAELAERVNNPAFKVVDEDLAALASYDRPDVIKQLFLDDEYAADILGEVRSFDGISDAAPMSDVTDVRNVIYQRTQDRLRDLPDVITVYRAGPLNDRDGVSSFTLNPSYNPSLELPWHKDRGSPVLESFTVRKEDILGSPDIIREFGESELIIRNSSVVPKYATGGLVSGIGSLGGEFL